MTLTPGGDSLLFLRSSAPSSFIHDLFSLDLATNVERRLLTATALLHGAEERLSTEEKAMRERMRMSGKGLQSFSLSPSDGALLLLPFAGQLHLFNRLSGEVTQLTHSSSPPLSPQWSPDGSMIAFVRDADIHVLDVQSGVEWQLTFIPSSSSSSSSSSASTLSNGLADFIAAEELSRFTGLWWSPDSLHVVYQQTDTAGMERFTIADPSDPAAVPAQFPYPRAGKKNASVRVGIVAVEKGRRLGRRSRGGSAANSSLSSPSHSTHASAFTTPTHGGGAAAEGGAPPALITDADIVDGDDSLHLTSLTESATGKVVFSPSSHSKRFHYKGAHITDSTIWMTWDRERWPYLVQVHWADVQCELTLVVLSRDQAEMAVLLCETISGDTRPLLVERGDSGGGSGGWVNVDQTCLEHLWLPGGRLFLWTTERSGRWTVELYDSKGQHVRRLVDQDVGYRSIIHVDARNDALYIHASADPTQQHLVRVPLGLQGNAGKPEVLTTSAGVHKCTIKRSSLPFVIHQHNSLSRMPVAAVRRLDNAGAIEEAKDSVLVRDEAEKMPFPSRVTIEPVTVSSTPLPLYTAVVPPPVVEADRQYPVLVYVYGGPHFQAVLHDYQSFILAHFFASHGYYVVSIDNRGTPYRSRAFERAISRHLATVPVEDQLEGLRAVMQKHPRMDADRVGVWGWSFGGLMSALLCQLHPDVYHAGVAGAPVTAWTDYDTAYTERYLGLPDTDAEAYRESSPMTYADRLCVPLLLLHGTSDDNVYVSHSLMLSNALFRAGKEHEFLALVNFTHMVSDPVVVSALYTKLLSFFNRHVKQRKARLDGQQQQQAEGEEDGMRDGQ